MKQQTHTVWTRAGEGGGFLLLSSAAYTQSNTTHRSAGQRVPVAWKLAGILPLCSNNPAGFSLPHCQHAFPLHTQTHTHSILLFLSPLQSSIIVSPHRHCRQWEVEWEKVKLICGHALCYCFNKNSLWTWQLHKYNKEAFGEASNMFPLYRRPLRYSVMAHYIEYLQINHKVVCDSFWSLAEEEEQWCLILTSN